jgi:hypothetical protein
MTSGWKCCFSAAKRDILLVVFGVYTCNAKSQQLGVRGFSLLIAILLIWWMMAMFLLSWCHSA